MDKLFVNINYRALCDRIDEMVTRNLFPEIEFEIAELDRFNKKEAQGIANRLFSRGFQNTIHGPYKDLFPGSYDSNVRDYTRKRFCQTLEAAEIFKSRCVVFHSGYYERYKNHKQEWLKRSLTTWEPVMQRAKKIGTVVAVENEYEKEPDTLLFLIKSISSPHFLHCVDVGHVNVFAETSIDQWIKTLGPYIAEFHLHDNRGDRDRHLPIGKGNIDFSLLVSLIQKYIKNEPLYTLEPAMEEDLEDNILGFKHFFTKLYY